MTRVRYQARRRAAVHHVAVDGFTAAPRSIPASTRALVAHQLTATHFARFEKARDRLGALRARTPKIRLQTTEALIGHGRVAVIAVTPSRAAVAETIPVAIRASPSVHSLERVRPEIRPRLTRAQQASSGDEPRPPIQLFTRHLFMPRVHEFQTTSPAYDYSMRIICVWKAIRDRSAARPAAEAPGGSPSGTPHYLRGGFGNLFLDPS